LFLFCKLFVLAGARAAAAAAGGRHNKKGRRHAAARGHGLNKVKMEPETKAGVGPPEE
jgi:hypothetical protein